MANLFFTTKGAPNAWNAANSMSSRMNERLEKLRQERETNAKLYFDQYLKARQQDDADAAAEAARVRQQARDAEADRKQRVLEERQAAKDRWEARTKALQNARLEGLIEAQQYDTERKKIDAEYEAEVKESQIAKNNRTGTGRSRTTTYDQTNGVPWYDSEGNEHFAKNYDVARGNSIVNGTWHEDTRTSSSTQTKETPLGTETSSRKTETQGKGHSEPPKKQGGSEKDNYKRGGNASSNQQQTQKKNKAPLS
jgi:multidrug efflux pump subunit AcrA (membrane-fusion protein)